MNVDTERTVCLEDISTMKQKNNWCSWCVRVFVGSEEGDWKTCGVGILTFKIGTKVINTLSQLNKELSQRGPNNPSELKAVVKIQKGLNSPTNREQATESMRRRVRDPDPNNEFVMNCDLREATNFEMEKSMIIYWTQRDKDLNLSISFLQCEIFVESWQIISSFTGNDYKADFIFPSVTNLDKILSILGDPNDKENFNILLSCFIVNEQYLNQLFTIFVKYKTNESISENDSQDKKNIIVQRYKILSKINDIVKFLLEDENPDLTLSLMREGIYECLLELIGSDDSINYLGFYKNQCRRRELFELSDKFKNAVETKFRIVYLKDYVFANSLNDKYLNKLKYLIVRINLAIIYNILEDFENVWRKVLDLIENDIESVNIFFNEFFQIYSEVGSSVMSNVSLVFFASNSHHDILKLVKNILDKKKENITLNDYKVLRLCFEIITMLSKATVKGTSRLFGEEVEQKNGEKFRFAELVKKGLCLSDRALTSSILELFSKLLEISQTPEKRKKFVHTINSYIIEPLMEIITQEEENSVIQPPNLISGILVLFLNNFLEDKNILEDKKLNKIFNLISTLYFFKKFNLLGIISKYITMYSRHKELCIVVNKIIKVVLESKDETLNEEISELNLLDTIFQMIIKNKKRKNLIYSSALSTIQFLNNADQPKLLESFINKNKEKIEAYHMEPDEKVFRTLMSTYRRSCKKSPVEVDEAVEGDFGSCSPPATDGPVVYEPLEYQHDKMSVPTRKKFNVHNINDDELELLKMKKEMVMKNRLQSKKEMDGGGDSGPEEMEEDGGDGPLLGKRDKSSS